MRSSRSSSVVFALIVSCLGSAVLGQEQPEATCDNGSPAVAYPQCSSAPSAVQYRCWQKTLQASQTYTNPYRDVKVRVDITGPVVNGVPFTMRAYAFWDGGSSFVFRAMFPYSGTYQWKTVCEAGCAANETGLVRSTPTALTVAPAQIEPENNLYSDGPLTARFPCARRRDGCPGLRHVSTAGKAFLWHGDSTWAATNQSCKNQWRAYVDTAKAAKFTVVQLGLAPRWAGESEILDGGPKNSMGYKPFSQLCTGNGRIPNDCSKWIPEYWRNLDGMIQYANDKGMVVFLAGLMAPLDGDPAAWNKPPMNLPLETSLPPLQEARTFARNLAARVAGSHVVLSPGFDHALSSDTMKNQIDQVGTEIHSSFTSSLYYLGPLLTNHTGTRELPDYQYLNDRPWLDFQLFQSGFADNDLTRITSRPMTLIPAIAGLVPPKTVINGEGIYDYGYDSHTETILNFNDFRARQVGWLSVLSGSYGYTYGSVGLWEWGICGTSSRPGWATTYETCDIPSLGLNQPTPRAGFKSYSEAMANPRRWGMKFLSDAAVTLKWNEAATTYWEQSRIKNQPAEAHKQMRLGRTRDLLVAYLPQNSKIVLDLAGTQFSAAPDAWMWLAGRDRYPNQAQHVSATPVAGYPSRFEFINPWAGFDFRTGYHDTALSIQRAVSSAFAWAGSSDMRIAAWPEFGSAGAPVLKAQVLTAERLPIGRPFVVTTTGPRLPRAIEVARDGVGNFILVWEQTDAATRRDSVEIARLSSNGEILVPPSIPTPVGNEASTANERLEPSVGAQSNGQFVVVWEEASSATEGHTILGQWFDSSGVPVGFPFGIESTVGGSQRAPKATCPPAGGCWVAWEQEDPKDGSFTVRAQRFSTSGVAEGLDFQLNTGSWSNMWLSRLAAGATGRVEAQWEVFGGTFEAPVSGGTLGVVFNLDGSLAQGESLIEAPFAE